MPTERLTESCWENSMEGKIRYGKVIVLGSGKLAYQCAAECRKYVEDVEVLEYKVTESTVLEKLCAKDRLPYACLDRKQLHGRLTGEGKETLVISAANTYLFPADVIGKRNLMIINWHNALLPKHKGRNAEAWSIYEGDRVTGITWHRITEEVDAGDIIAREEILIDGNTTALSLYQKQCDLGGQVFSGLVLELLTGQIRFRRQEEDSRVQMHYSREIPNGGYLDPAWEARQISCFLRAMDYGGLLLLGEMHVVWENIHYTFRKYRIAESDAPKESGLQGRDLILYKDGYQFVLRNLHEE